MKIKILRGTVAGGKPVKVDDEVTVGDHEGKELIRMKKAVAIVEAAPAADEVKKEPSAAAPAVSAPAPAKEAEKMEDGLEKDTDLGEEKTEQEPDLAAFTYERLVEIAKDYGIEKPEKMKKQLLIRAIQVKQDKA